MKKILNNLSKAIFIIFLFLSLTRSVGLTSSFIYKELRNIKFNLHKSFDEKMRLKFGKFYDYMVFVKENTPENANIGIPPQKVPWLTTGNGAYVYYFLYPRIPSNSPIDSLSNNPEMTHVLLVNGDSLEDKDSVWPKFNLPVKNITYYPSKNYLNGWGIIELKK